MFLLTSLKEAKWVLVRAQVWLMDYPTEKAQRETDFLMLRVVLKPVNSLLCLWGN